ncbi:Galactosyldiacylglycerol synthase [Candidatus Hydrogenisulfobacillus filiaventi]|uniref:Galactosyldiacylglycerol synthase n=1 Tax=Candidatus Hydrogenisulfobacillus filiaventi TaxID=2707344 RepID=A0A6F8ZGD8_9FIRM|nr:galactosyldiacylglycerol synthase [Bacillota bacterium]CAB1128662.1 Galactosyldiacylglycerol synthase [Candidatus Hydrogenisulfobacillus filiaventi]
MARIVIASLPIGTGHDVAAEALAAALSAGGHEVVFSQHLVPAAALQTHAYFAAVRYVPGWYGRLFRWVEHAPAAWPRYRRHWRRVGERRLLAAYRELEPDIIVATHPFALTAWGWVKSRYPELRLVGVLTDLSVHRFWWEPEADGYAVWFPEQRLELMRWGCDPDRIHATGIPIRAAFAHPGSGVYAPGTGPILLLGGGLGIGPYRRILRRLAVLDHPVVAICGHNEALRLSLLTESWPSHVSIRGFEPDMPGLMRQAALVVGKPGGVTAAEVAQSRVPWILSHWIAGQEEINRDRLVAHGLAVREQGDLVALAERLLAPGPERERMRQQQALWRRPDAARHIAAWLAQLEAARNFRNF